MGILDRLRNRNRFRHHLDSFALTRETLWTSIANAIKDQVEAGKTVIVASHFLDSFSSSQALVETNRFDYEIISYPLTRRWLAENLGPSSQADTPGKASRSKPKVVLALTDLLIPLDQLSNEKILGEKLALMVTEVHPLVAKDERLIEFAKSLPCPVELGYFMALDDAVLQRTISPETINVLRQLGLGENDLITSSLITKRLRKLLRLQSNRLAQYQEANSAEEWYEIHGELDQ